MQSFSFPLYKYIRGASSFKNIRKIYKQSLITLPLVQMLLWLLSVFGQYIYAFCNATLVKYFFRLINFREIVLFVSEYCSIVVCKIDVCITPWPSITHLVSVRHSVQTSCPCAHWGLIAFLLFKLSFSPISDSSHSKTCNGKRKELLFNDPL